MSKIITPEEEEVLAFFVEKGYRHFRTGSREICDPPVLTTDVDWVVLIEDDPIKLKATELMLLTGLGPKPGKEGYESDLCNLYVGNVNVVVCETPAQFAAWRLATAAANQLNLELRSSRVAVFRAICKSEWGSDDLQEVINSHTAGPETSKILPEHFCL